MSDSFNNTPVGRSTQNYDQTSVRSTARKSSGFGKSTPHRKTPASRKIKVARREFLRTPEEEEELPCLTGLISCSWQTYKATPLYNFKSEVNHLKKYARLLSAFMEAERRKGEGVEVEAEVADKVELSFYPGLQVSKDDPVALQILMRSKSKAGNGGLQTVLTAYLFGVEMGSDPKLEDTFIHYPVMLVKGSVNLIRSLLDWLQIQFDCCVSRLKFSSHDLNWMLAMWSGQLTGGRSKPVELTYTLPPSDGLDKITFTIDAHDCKEAWDCIHDNQYEDVTTEEVQAFITSLENHFYRTFHIKLSALPLTRVGTAMVYVGAEGKLKLFSEDYALTVLRHITCLGLEQLRILRK